VRILAFDTTTRFLTAAVLEDGRIVSSFHKITDLKQSSYLLPAIDDVLARAGIGLKDIDRIAVSMGPGSFAGLRIGFSVCKAFNLVTGVKVIGVPTMEAIAMNFSGLKGVLCPVLDARKNKIYAAAYKSDGSKLERISECVLTDTGSFLGSVGNFGKDLIIFGDGVKLYKDDILKVCPKARIIEGDDWYPVAENVARLGFEMARRGEESDIRKLNPMYLHPKECSIRGFKY